MRTTRWIWTIGPKHWCIAQEMVESRRVLLAGALDSLFYKALEIGHMGKNAREEKLYHALKV